MSKGKGNEADEKTIDVVATSVVDDADGKNSGFDYSTLPDRDRQAINNNVQKINSLLKTTAESIIKIGGYLAEIKSILPFGSYDRWLESEFPDWNRSTTKQWVKVYHKFKSYEVQDINLTPTVMYELAAGSVPTEAIDEAMELSREQKVTVNQAKDIKSKYKNRDLEATTNAPESVEVEAPTEVKEEKTVESENPGDRQQIVGVIKKKPPTWKIKNHTVICCDPNSRHFTSLLQEEVSIVLSFPHEKNWQFELENYGSMNTYYNRENQSFLDEDFKILLELTGKVIELSNPDNDLVAVLFIPHPMILSLLDSYNLVGFIADPDYDRCLKLVDNYESVDK